MLIYCATISPYVIAFVDSDNPNMYTFSIIDKIIDLSFLIEIILNFFTVYEDVEDNIIKNHKKIIYNYLKLWFLLDVITIFPFDYIFPETNSDSYYYNYLKSENDYENNGQMNISFINTSTKNSIKNITRITRLPKIYKVIRLSKFFRVLRNLKGFINDRQQDILNNGSNNVKSFSKYRITKFLSKKLNLNVNIEKFLYFILGFLILTHLSACIWYILAKYDDFSPDTWVSRLGFLDMNKFDLYIISIYFTLTTVTTVGYGDVNANTVSEKIYNLFIMAIGVLMYSFAIGSLTNIVMNLDKKNAETNQKLRILKSIKSEFKIDNDLYNKTRRIIKYDLWRIQRDDNSFLQILPNELKKELSKIIHDNVIKKLTFFHNQSIDFISFVASSLRPMKLNNNDIIYNVLEVMDESKFSKISSKFIKKN